MDIKIKTKWVKDGAEVYGISKTSQLSGDENGNKSRSGRNKDRS